MEEGKKYKTDKGTPQGGVISPILAKSIPPLRSRPMVREKGQKRV